VRTLLLQADTGSEEELMRMFGEYFAAWPRLDVCIPNAGTQTGEDSHTVSMSSFDRIIDINLRGYFICAREALKHFVERPEGPAGGVIVFDSSVHQIVPKPTYGLPPRDLLVLSRTSNSLPSRCSHSHFST
jgi:glucose 1-dehydrogenase